MTHEDGWATVRIESLRGDVIEAKVRDPLPPQGKIVWTEGDNIEEEMYMSTQSTEPLRHTEIDTDSYWLYDIVDGEGDRWGNTMDSREENDDYVLATLQSEIEHVREALKEGSHWYEPEHYPEPLRIVKRHVRITSERTEWEDA